MLSEFRGFLYPIGKFYKEITIYKALLYKFAHLYILIQPTKGFY